MYLLEFLFQFGTGKSCEIDIERIKRKVCTLETPEIHVAWLLRRYLEQSKVSNFDKLDYRQRKSQVDTLRKTELLRLQRSKNIHQYKQTRKNFLKTASYTHLNYTERVSFIKEVAQCVSGWGFARLFAECIDKVHFDPSRAPLSIDEQAFEQIVSRFEQYLQITSVAQ